MHTNASPLIIIGAGGAGLIAAWKAASLGVPVLVLERNRKPGVKLLISGGGKCNITHAGTVDEILAGFAPREARFLKPSFYRLTNNHIIALLDEHGVASYARENGRVFPISGRAGDVVDVFLDLVKGAGAVIRDRTRVTGLVKDEQGICGVTTERGTIDARQVIVATGGISYRKTGTTGDGYCWAEATGHSLVPLRPALAPIGVQPPLPAAWRGIALRGGSLALVAGGTTRLSSPEDILITHEGLSGPGALALSTTAAEAAADGPASLVFDFLPRWDVPTLDRELLARLSDQKGRMIETILHEWLPNRMVGELLRAIPIDPATRGGALTAPQRREILRLLKGWTIGTVGMVNIDRGEVTAGGVALADVDPRSMRSRKVRGLYFAGEVLDIAGPIGGYNLQAAFSTGAVAGESAAQDWKAMAGSSPRG